MSLSDNELITFESGLDPLNLKNSKIPAMVIGYGEISTVFEIDGDENNAYKRLALFEDRNSAEDYTKIYNAYCDYLRNTGLNLPEDKTVIIDNDKRATILYIVQRKLDPENFAHKLILNYSEQQASDLLTKICDEIEKVWKFNSKNKPDLEIALDGQLSNWVIENDNKIFYIDTSTPLFKIKNVEQLNPDLILKTAPSFLRWVLRLFFLKDVMNRYYEPRSVYMDLIANLHKEQRPDLVPIAIDIVNKYIKEPDKKFDIDEINKYYKEDKLIWTLFLAFRKFDRFLKSKIFHQRYEYILPGKIKR